MTPEQEQICRQVAEQSRYLLDALTINRSCMPHVLEGFERIREACELAELSGAGHVVERIIEHLQKFNDRPSNQLIMTWVQEVRQAA